MPSKTLTGRLPVTPETHRKAKLLAALLDQPINLAVDLAITEKLNEVKAQKSKPEKPISKDK